jgi:methylglutaconyl-CoA hydratase
MNVAVSVDARGVASVTLNRPQRANAYDYATLAAVADAFDRLGRDEHVRAVALRGEGKHFCSGADVAAGAEPGPGQPGVYELLSSLETTPRPTIAVVQGACIGGGLVLAAMCDMLIASSGAFFSLPEVRLGLAPGPLGLLFARTVGQRHYARYGMTGQRFDARDAHRIGLASVVCDDVDQALRSVLDEILLAAPRAAVNAKRIAIRLGGVVDSADIDALQREFLAQHDGAEGIEGRASFRGKRKPWWHPKEEHA